MDAWVRHLAEAFDGPVRLLDAQGRQVFANQAWQVMFGGADAPADAWRRLVRHQEDLDRLDDQVPCQQDRHHPGAGGRVWIRLASNGDDGPDTWWVFTCTAVRDDGGDYRGCITSLVLSPADDSVADRRREVFEEAEALIHVGTWEWEVASGHLWWSDEVFRIFGYQPGAFTPDFAAFTAAIHEEDRDDVRSALNRALAAGVRYEVVHRVVRPDGDVRVVREKAIVTREADGTVTRLLGTVCDITQETFSNTAREQARAALASSEARYRMLAENASDVVWQLDTDGRVAWVSDSVRSVLGWTPNEVIDHPGEDFLHPDDRGRGRTLAQIRAGDTGPTEVRMRCADGTYRWMSSVLHPTDTPDGVAIVGSLRDIQAEVEARIDLEHAIGHDSLTGLATLASTSRRIAEWAARLAGRDQVVAVMCIGVDGLGTINDAYAHAAGDRVLSAVASRIVAAVGDADLVGRGAGNEIHVVVPNLHSGADAGPLAERILRGVSVPTPVGDVTLTPTVSIGIATGTRDDDPDDLVRGAGAAMRLAKVNGRDRFEFLNQDMSVEAQRRLRIEASIREGLDRDEFTPWFQPIVELATGAVVGHEALVRWIKPDGRLVEAWEFLPVAERGHLIADLDLVVVHASIAALSRDPDSELFIAVNVSAASLQRGDYDTRVLAALERWGVPADRLHLEVTETALLDITADIRTTVANLAHAGIRWYVDDFGTGYSSISHLRDFPISGLKLDRSFTAGIAAGDDTCWRLADGLIGLAEGLGLDTVAEGIEGESEQAALTEQGWSKGQGWRFGRPAPEREVAGRGPKALQ